MTGDVGWKDSEGFIWFKGRDDDVISSAGYRVGPGEIEDCILKHPAVALVAVIGVADSVRGEVPKAFVVLKAGQAAGPELAAEIQAFVKIRVAPYQYPREVDFIDALPLTASGKIIRRTLREQEAAKRASPPASASRVG